MRMHASKSGTAFSYLYFLILHDADGFGKPAQGDACTPAGTRQPGPSLCELAALDTCGLLQQLHRRNLESKG